MYCPDSWPIAHCLVPSAFLSYHAPAGRGEASVAIVVEAPGAPGPLRTGRTDAFSDFLLPIAWCQVPLHRSPHRRRGGGGVVVVLFVTVVENDSRSLFFFNQYLFHGA